MTNKKLHLRNVPGESLPSMETSYESTQINCLNCGTSVEGKFCYQCGQRTRDNSDRSVVRLLGETLSNLFFFDNRFFVAMRDLFRFPGRMTVAFLDGKRKKYISPITLFFFINLIYFFVNPLSDYSLALYDQVHSQPYSGQWTKDLVLQKMQDYSLSFQAYASVYQKMSDNIAKSIMIINVPLIAFFLYFMTFKKRKYYFDNLIFAFHFFSLTMTSWILMSWSTSLIDFLAGQEDSMLADITSTIFVMVIPVVYAILSIKKFIKIKWYLAIPAGLGVMVSVVLASLIYRFIIFNLTIFFT